MDIDTATTLEESIRKLRGMRYILSELASIDYREPDEKAMFELLGINLDDITGDLTSILQSL